MRSITYTANSGQVESAKVYPFGMYRPSPLKGQSRGTGGALDEKRGEIVGFTAAARRRMRHAMLTLYVPDAFLVGVTFTVPWKGSNFEPLMDEFRECWHRFGVSFRRGYPHSAMIYRVELQQRGAPHIHALVWYSSKDAAAALGGCACVPLGGTVASSLLNVSLGAMWRESVPDLHHGSFHAFVRFGVKVEPIPDAGAMFRYLADHASKHKQAQLGYKGKQWGIVGRSNLVRREPVRLPPFLFPRHEVMFNRLLRKVMRYRLQASRHHWKRLPPFGSVLKGSARLIGDFYLRQDTVMRMWEHSLALSDWWRVEPR